MLERIIRGGQTGAEQAAWRAAKAYGVTTGGWMPKGFLTEAGPRPEFAALYGAVETPTANYRQRTEYNVRDTHVTLWFGATDTPGAKTTLNARNGMERPHLLIVPHCEIRPSAVAARLRSHKCVALLNIAGNRESKAPGIGDRVERFLGEVFRQLGHKPESPQILPPT
jgi:hypothetical protein